MSSFSVSSYSSLSSYNGVFGLASGLNTDEIIESLTSITQSKIKTQLQNKQLALWKQESYKEVTSAMNSLRDTFFSNSSSSTNLLSSSFYTNKTTEASSSAVSISSSSSASDSFVIESISQLAQSEALYSSQELSNTTITTGTINDSSYVSNLSSSTMTFAIDGLDYDVTVSFSNYVPSQEVLTDTERKQEVADYIDSQLVAGGVGEYIRAGLDGDGNIAFEGLNGNQIGVSGTTGNAATALGVAVGTTMFDAISTSGTATSLGSTQSLGSILSGSSLTFSFNGVSQTITFDYSDSDQYSTPEDMVNYLQSKLDSAYGSGKIELSFDDAGAGDGSGSMSMKTTSDTDTLGITASTNATLMSSTSTGILGLKTGVSNRVSFGTSISSLESNGTFANSALEADRDTYTFEINGVSIECNSTDALSQIVNKINNSDAGVEAIYSTTTDTFMLVSKNSGDLGEITITNDDGGLAETLFGTSADHTRREGKDAILSVSFDDGYSFTEITRSSNTFTLDGMNLTLNELHSEDDDNITFKTTNDVSGTVDNIKSFIEQYNALIDLCVGFYTDKPNSDYSPLTDEEKADMTESQIDTWETEAKKGLLFSDDLLEGMIREMRTALFAGVEEAGLSLSSIGIATGDYTDNGKLQIDEDKLTQALSENSENVIKLFTHDDDDSSKSGVAVKMNTIIQKYVGIGGTSGALVDKAGSVSSSYSEGQDSLSTSIRLMDVQLTKLKTQLATEEALLLSKYTALETYISNMNSQSSWLSESMASYY